MPGAVTRPLLEGFPHNAPLGMIGGVRNAATPTARPAAVVSQTIMAVLTLGYIVMAVRSFIQARANRTS